MLFQVKILADPHLELTKVSAAEHFNANLLDFYQSIGLLNGAYNGALGSVSHLRHRKGLLELSDS